MMEIRSVEELQQLLNKVVWSFDGIWLFYDLFGIDKRN